MDAKLRKEVLRLVPYGIYAVTCGRDDELNAFTGTWLTQCSFEPCLLAACVRGDSLSHELIDREGAFVVNFVAASEQAFLQSLFKPVAKVGDKLAGHAYRPSVVGAPIFDHALAWLACRVVDRARPGDHTVFFAEVVDAGRAGAAAPLTLADTPWSYGG